LSSTTDRARERGQVLVLFAGGLVALLIVAALAFDVGMMLVERRDQQNAADAAALAGVTGGASASRVIAAANDATVVAWSRSGYEVTVTVQVGEQRATARATDEP
jgi:Flp pilus assembly protein TadG